MSKKILIVDDNRVMLRAFSMKLSACGYEVLTAEDGAAAVSLTRQQRPDLILLDISFPPDVAHGGGVSWDGFLIMTWLKRMEEAQGIPIFVITALEDEKTKMKAKAAGAARFFQKPVTPDDLLPAIQEVLGEGEVASQLSS
jgi:CheY-like chemotaxis protein